MKMRLGSESARMAGSPVRPRLPGALATLGVPIMALAKKGGNGRAILANFAILGAALAAVTAGSAVRRPHQYQQGARHSPVHRAFSLAVLPAVIFLRV